MTRPPLAQVQIEAEIVRLGETLEAITDDYAECAVAAASADATFKATYAARFLVADGPIGQREQQAASECETEYRDFKIADARLRATGERGRNIRAQLDSLRTLAANVRPQVNG
jgi:hypothetical protein